MKPLLVVLFLICVVMQMIQGQSVCASNQLATEAEIYYRQKTDINKAVELYRDAFRMNCTDGSKTLDAINAATSIHDTASSIEFIGNSMSLGITPTSIQRLWGHMGNGMDLDHCWSRLDTTIIQERYQSTLDSSMIRRLKLMAEQDQRYRGTDDDNWKLQRSLDSLNWKALQQMVQELGRLPYYRELGKDGQENLELLFYHMDRDIIEGFLPYIFQCVQVDNANLGTIILYQLERIGMSDGVIYTIREDGSIVELMDRTRMKNGFYCQSFGEWFDEKSPMDGKMYATPIDPKLDISEVNRVRRLFCLATIEERRNCRPWVQNVSVEVFEKLV